MNSEKLELRAGIAERTVAFSLKIIRFYRMLEGDSVGRITGKQLLRSGTAVGATVQEAQGAQSKADFIAKMSIAHKEALESVYWLRLIREDGVIKALLDELVSEASQVVKMLSKILITSKDNTNHKRHFTP